MMPRSIRDVAERHLCSGCGTCAYLAPEHFEMVDDLQQGRRPLSLTPLQRTGPQEQALAACPGRALQHDGPLPAGHLAALGDEWGPVLEVWEGWASDPETRFRGSSGGVATALAAHALATSAHGVLHVAARTDVPYLNETVLSRTPAELVERAGSRYAPASPCEALHLVEQAPGPCVFIGKPCDVAGARRAAQARPALAERLDLTIGVFCAGTPTTQGTLEAVRALGLEADRLTALRYRGEGWPGSFRAQDADGREGVLSYEQSWGAILQKHRQWRCMVCADHTGEFADLSVGDAWYRAPEPGEDGRSLVLVRTERGRRALHSALASGAVTLRRADPDVLPRSQPNLVRTRGAVLGRVLVLRGLGLPAPRYRHMPMWRSWRALSGRAKVQATVGTVRRILRRRLLTRVPVHPSSSEGRS